MNFSVPKILCHPGSLTEGLIKSILNKGKLVVVAVFKVKKFSHAFSICSEINFSSCNFAFLYHSP